MKWILTVSFLIAFSIQANANNDLVQPTAEQLEDPRFYELAPPNVTFLSEEVHFPMTAQAPCLVERDGRPPLRPKNPSDLTIPLSGGKVALATIVNVGKAVWKIIVAGQSVSEKNYGQASHALPQGISCWAALENWDFPKKIRTSIEYKNKLGMKVAHLDYAIIFTPGGSYHNRGEYLTNIQVIEESYHLFWGGFKFNASAIVNVTNAGSRNNPLAQAEVTVQWGLKSHLKEDSRSTTYIIRGNGRWGTL